MGTPDTELQVADTVFTAELAVLRAYRAVDELNGAVASALRILDDAELASAKARLNGREDSLRAPAAEHLERLQTRCAQLPSLATELDAHLDAAARETRLAADLLDQLDGFVRGGSIRSTDPRDQPPGGPQPPAVTSRDDAVALGQLRTRVAVLSEVLDLAKPLAQTTLAHVQRSREASQAVTVQQVVQPRTLERSIRSAGSELGRADEGARLLESVIERAASRAQESVDAAVVISERARGRMAAQARRPDSPATPSGRPPLPRPGDPLTHDRASVEAQIDQAGQLIADRVVQAAAQVDLATIDALTGGLDTEQLRALVRVIAHRAAESARAQPTPPAQPTLQPPRGYLSVVPPAASPALVQPESPGGALTALSSPAAVCDLAITVAAPLFGVTAAAVRGPARSRPISDARAVAMTAARASGLTLPAIGREFGKDHGSVLHAVRRTQERPRLADAAARVTTYIAEQYTRRLPVTDLTAPPAASTPTGALVPAARDVGAGGGGTGAWTVIDQAIAATAAAFGADRATLVGTDRTRAAADARAVAMTAARMRGQSLPQIARAFGRDHTVVLHVTRRIQATPPLHDLAAQIASTLTDDVPARSTRAGAPRGPGAPGVNKAAGWAVEPTPALSPRGLPRSITQAQVHPTRPSTLSVPR